MSTRSAESRDNSPDGHDAAGEKRSSKKRKVLSCYACRNRKMKCDRVFPVCGRCQKTGRADQCTYDPRLLEEGLVNGDGHVDGAPSFVQPDNTSPSFVPSDLLSWKLRVQERRLEMMEKRLAVLNGGNSASLDVATSRYDDFEPNEPHAQEDMMFRGKGFKTQFYGSTSPLSALTQFSELQTFTREALSSDVNFGSVRHNFRAFRERRKELMKDKRLQTHGSDDEIFALIPAKSLVDPQVSLYFQTWETSYRIIHETSFWKDYQAFWERRSNEDPPASFAAILVYMMAITKCAKPNEQNVFIGDSSADREDALSLIDTCDAWLQRQSRKSLTLAFFQLQCLSLLAKRVNCLKLKQDWVNAGDVIRLAIASGMHRNPSRLAGGRISEFDKEMRRRLWVTIVELELQTSIDSGHQSSASGLYFDVQPPANLPDDTFSPDVPQIPAGRPVEHFTPTSYLNWTLRSLPLRIHLLQLLSNPAADMHYSDVLHYDAQITTLLSSLPTWDDTRATIPIALLDLQLRQFLLILHRPYAMLAAKNSRYTYSFTSCIDTTSTVMSIHENLISKGLLALSHTRNDILRAAVTVAQAVYHNCLPTSPNESRPTAPTPPNSSIHAMDVGSAAMGKQAFSQTGEIRIPQLPVNNFLSITLCTAAISILDKARQIFELKVLRLGTGYIEYWLICSAVGLMPSTTQPTTSIASITNTAPDDIRARGRRALERLTSLCFRVLALQRDSENSFASSLRATMTAVSPGPPTPFSNASLPDRTPATSSSERSMPIVIPGATGLVGALADGSIPGVGPGIGTDPAMGSGAGYAFGGLQDMQMDLTGWSFPEFWAFDMLGDF